MPSVRPQRVADQIRAVLSEACLLELRDPRLRHVTLSEVRLTRDLRLADVYYSVYSGGETERDAAGEALHRATPRLRHLIGEKLRMRYVPDLRFHPDRSVDYALHIEEVLADIASETPARDGEE